MNDTVLTVFVVVTALAVVMQAGILVGMFFAMRKTSAKVESLAEEVKTKVLPAAELAQSMMIELRPKIVTLVVQCQRFNDRVAYSNGTRGRHVDRHY